jgi:hypothetical protein
MYEFIYKPVPTNFFSFWSFDSHVPEVLKLFDSNLSDISGTNWTRDI